MSANINTQGMFYIWFGLKWAKRKKRSRPTVQQRVLLVENLWFYQCPRFHVTAEFFSISSIKTSSKMSYICMEWIHWLCAKPCCLAAVLDRSPLSNCGVSPMGCMVSISERELKRGLCEREVVRHEADLVGRFLVNRAFRQFGPGYFPPGFQQKWGDCFSSGGWKPFPKDVYMFLKKCWGNSVGGWWSLGNLKKFRAFRV